MPDPNTRKVFVRDTEIAAMLGIGVSWLQHDRLTAKRIPYIRLGDRVLYDPDVVLSAVRGLTEGGPRGRRTRRNVYTPPEPEQAVEARAAAALAVQDIAAAPDEVSDD